MNATVRHRGPDDEGYVLFHDPDARPVCLGGTDTLAGVYGADFPYCPPAEGRHGPDDGARMAMGHRRLAIIDLTPAGHQPMTSASGRYWIVYNGEIYNFPELRQELEAAGCRFRSRTDTEVILNAYDRWGPDCLKRFNGMFALVLMDRIAGRIFAARDRFGVKPLYYWISPAGLVAFASEIKQFAVLPGWQARLHGWLAAEFLTEGLLDHTGETLFDGVHQLRGGEYIECPLENVPSAMTVKRWYDLPVTPFTGSFAEAAEQCRSLLADAVRVRLRADVPVGSCLSGGIDSSSIVCMMHSLLKAQNTSAQQQTFSAGAEDAAYDERPFIAEVVGWTGVQNRMVYPAMADLAAEWDQLIQYQDEPFGSTSIYAQWRVFKLAAEHGIKVMLDGQGADELLAGYPSYFGPHLASQIMRGRWRTLVHETRCLHRCCGTGYGQLAAKMSLALMPDHWRTALIKAAQSAVFVPSCIDLARLGISRAETLETGHGTMRSVGQMSRNQLLASRLPQLLHWEDRDSMAHSVEARVPFLDYRLVEWLFGLPDDFKLSEGTTKRILREAMRGLVPEPVLARTDKMGFVTPEQRWIRNDMPDLFREWLREAVSSSQGIIRADACAVLDDIIAGRRPFDFTPWRWICFGRWMRNFRVNLP